MTPLRPVRAPIALALLCTALGACSSLTLPGGYDILNGSEDAARQPTAPRPEPDARGVISYPNYQVAVARPGETVGGLAGRLGLDPTALARKNGLPEDAALHGGELILLSSRVPESTGALTPSGSVDVATLAGSALDRAEGKPVAAPTAKPVGKEPRRHVVKRGETAYSIARSYNVSVKSLSDWNGLDDNLTVREGQTLLIPVATGPAPIQTEVTQPGAGSPSPEPPSAATPQPAENLAPAAAAAATTAPASPAPAAQQQTSASDTARLMQPVSGKIIRGYAPGKNEGLDFGAAAGTAVRAADAGTVAAITRDTDQVPILVLRHDDNLLTVYANVDNVVVEKGTRVSRGQRLASVRASDPAFLHFEVRKGFESVDPLPYLAN